jgi:hypothetical protein
MESESVPVSVEAATLPPPQGCTLCSRTLTPEITCTVNGQLACTSCAEQVQREVEQQTASGNTYPLAVLGGLVGTLVSAAIWAAIVVVTNYEVGYVAILVGFLTGFGVKLGARKARGKELQILAAALSVVGLAAAKYFIFAYTFVKIVSERGSEMSVFDPIIFHTFGDKIGSMLSPFDLLWLFLAVGAAYKVPAPSIINVER